MQTAEPKSDASNLLAESPASYRGRLRSAITAAYFTSFFAIGVVLSSLGPILPVLATKAGTTIDAIGVLFVARSTGYMVGSAIGGFIFDRVRRTHIPLLAGNGLCSIGCLLLPSLKTKSALLAAVASQGFCMGLLDTGGNVLLIWLHGSGRVEPYMQTMHFFFALGAVIAPMAIELTVHISGRSDGFGAAFYSMALLLLAACVPLAGTSGPRPPKEQASSSSSSSITTTSSSFAAASSSSDWTAEAPGGDATTNRGNGSSGLGRRRLLCGLAPFEAWLVASSSLCLCLYVGCEVGFGGFIFTYAVTNLRMADTVARGLNSMYWGGLALGRLGAIPAAARFRPESILNVSVTGSALAAAALLWLGVPDVAVGHTASSSAGGIGGASSSSIRAASAVRSAVGEGTIALAWMATAALGLCHAPIFPTTLTHAERCMRVSGRVASVFVVSAALGEALLPVLIALAYLADHASFPRIIFAATIGQIVAYAGARIAARRLLRAGTDEELHQQAKNARGAELAEANCTAASVSCSGGNRSE